MFIADIHISITRLENAVLYFKTFRDEPYIHFCTQCIIITLAGWEAITDDVLQFKNIITFEGSCIAICFPYIHLIINEKDNLSVKKVAKKFTKLNSDSRRATAEL